MSSLNNFTYQILLQLCHKAYWTVLCLSLSYQTFEQVSKILIGSLVPVALTRMLPNAEEGTLSLSIDPYWLFWLTHTNAWPVHTRHIVLP